jgi:hypothetical protein
MASTLRALLIQRAARLQERPALTAPGWDTLSYAQLRNRVEGVAFGLLAGGVPPGPVCAATGTPWDWAAELAAAASGLPWDSQGWPVPGEVLGGSRFHTEAGRGLYHGREADAHEEAPFHRGLTQGEVLRRLARLNDRLGWDHETAVALPLGRLGDPLLRAALWSTLYAGSHATLHLPPAKPAAAVGVPRSGPGSPWDQTPFEGFWD